MGTIDTMGCQKESAKTMTEQGAEAVLALKDNQPPLHGEGQLWFEDVKADRLAHLTTARHTTTDADHGRLETRHDWLTADSECVGVQGSWAKIARVGVGESHRAGSGAVSSAQRYGLPALPCEAVRVAQAVREHWGVDTALHGGLDVSVREDAWRLRQGHGAQKMAVRRHRAWNRLRRASGHKRGRQPRRQRAGWDRAYLLQVLIG
jgi:predicted transposase YbfD/YdcC